MGIWKISKPVNHVSLIYLGSRVFSVTRFITFCNFASRTAWQWQVFDKTVTARILGMSFCSSVRSVHHDLRPWQMLAFWSSSTTTSRLQYGQVLRSPTEFVHLSHTPLLLKKGAAVEMMVKDCGTRKGTRCHCHPVISWYFDVIYANQRFEVRSNLAMYRSCFRYPEQEWLRGLRLVARRHGPERREKPTGPFRATMVNNNPICGTLSDRKWPLWPCPKVSTFQSLWFFMILYDSLCHYTAHVVWSCLKPLLTMRYSKNPRVVGFDLRTVMSCETGTTYKQLGTPECIL